MITPWLLLAGHAALWLVRYQRLFNSHVDALPRLRKLRRDERQPLPELTVFVPARNEERAIRQSLTSLLRQRYPGLRVVCANDHSTDGTRGILEELSRQFPAERFMWFDVPDLPPGWMGKCHGLWRAVQRHGRRGDYYLFTDGDVIHAAGTLERAVRQAEETGTDLFAMVPRIDCIGFWENAVLPILSHLGMSALDPRNINDPEKREVAGIGAFCLIRRSMYEHWGGHRKIRGEVVDDMAMGLMTKRAGGRLMLAFDRRAIHLRMYDGLHSIVCGFEKNMHSTMGGSLLMGIAAAVGLFMLHWLPLIVAAWGTWRGELALIGAALALHFCVGIMLWLRVRKLMTLRPMAVILGYPLGAAVAAGTMLRSTWHGSVQGTIVWRGRRIKKPRQHFSMFASGKRTDAEKHGPKGR